MYFKLASVMSVYKTLRSVEDTSPSIFFGNEDDKKYLFNLYFENLEKRGYDFNGQFEVIFLLLSNKC
jgi:hypothetical protein